MIFSDEHDVAHMTSFNKERLWNFQVYRVFCSTFQLHLHMSLDVALEC